MTDREIIWLNINLKESKLTNEQQVKVWDMIEEYHNTFSFCDEIGACPQIKVHLSCRMRDSFRRHQNYYRVCANIHVLNDTIVHFL